MKYTDQEVFNKVWDHFVVQQQPASVSTTSRCLYRGLNDAKCAFGIFIPDDSYTPEMERMSICEMLDPELDYLPAELIDSLKEHTVLLGDLQQVHDETAKEYGPEQFTEQIRKELIALAKINALEIPK